MLSDGRRTYPGRHSHTNLPLSSLQYSLLVELHDGLHRLVSKLVFMNIDGGVTIGFPVVTGLGCFFCEVKNGVTLALSNVGSC